MSAPESAALSEAKFEFDTQVRRLLDRLSGININRLPDIAAEVRDTCLALLAISARLGDPAPVPLPTLRPTALGDQVAVLAADLRAAALRVEDAGALAQATEILTALRRSV